MTHPLINSRYRIFQSLGEGGFGKTFLAEDTHKPSRPKCVIKQLKPVVSRPEVFAIVRERFAREAAVLESVGRGHSQIPDLYAYFEEQGQFYLVQEWIEGNPLSTVSNRPWSDQEIHRLLADTLKVLVHVHQQKIIHRDIKPDNIILRASDQLPCLIDFGAVKEVMSTVLDTHNNPQKSSLAIGTPGFMAPEQAIGRPTFASDLYSLGMSAICLLTARNPLEFPADQTTGEVLWHQYAPNINSRLRNVIDRAVQPYGHDRFMTAIDMQSALERRTFPSKPFGTLTRLTRKIPIVDPAVDTIKQALPSLKSQVVKMPLVKATQSEAPSLTARELKARYKRGERDFRGLNLQGLSLRKMNLANIDLSGANLNNTDLRATNFQNARLMGTQFCGAKTGITSGVRHLARLSSLILWMSFIPVAWLTIGISGFRVLALFYAPAYSETLQADLPALPGLILLAITILGTLFFQYHRGVSAVLTFATIPSVAVCLIVGSSGWIGELAFMVALFSLGNFLATVALTGLCSGPLTFFGLRFFAALFFGYVINIFPNPTTELLSLTESILGLVAVMISFCLMFLYSHFIIHLSMRALAGDPRDKLIRDIAIGTYTVTGTSFRGADLTEANFSQATLRHTKFVGAKLLRTRFHLTEGLHLSRVDKTILSNRKVLNLLVTLKPEPGKSYSHLNLRGSNLNQAALADLDLTATDLSEATLENADLQRSNLSKARALGTNFRNANLTQACLDNWETDSTTQLAESITGYMRMGTSP